MCLIQRILIKFQYVLEICLVLPIIVYLIVFSQCFKLNCYICEWKLVNSGIKIRPKVTKTESISHSLDVVLNSARAMRLRIREIPVKMKTFLLALGTGELNNDIEAVEVVYQNYGNFIKLKNAI